MESLIVCGEDTDESSDLIRGEVATASHIFDELDLLPRVDQTTHILIELLESTSFGLLLIPISVATSRIVLRARSGVLLRDSIGDDDGRWRRRSRGSRVGDGSWLLGGCLFAVELRDTTILEGHIDRKDSLRELVLESIFPYFSVILLDILIARLT